MDPGPYVPYVEKGNSMNIPWIAYTFDPVTDDVISVTNEKTGEVATVYPKMDLTENSSWEMCSAPHRACIYLRELAGRLCPYFGLTTNQIPTPKIMRWVDKWKVIHTVLQCTVEDCFSIVISTAIVYIPRVSGDAKCDHEN